MSDSHCPADTVADGLFLHTDEASTRQYRHALESVAEVVTDSTRASDTVYSGADPAAVRASFDEVDCLPLEGSGLDEALETVRETVLSDAVRMSHPWYLAHLNCAPMVPAVAADTLVSTLNQSHAAWDLGPSVDVLEEAFVAEFADLLGLPDSAAGVFTSGGTQANFTALLLARGWYADEYLDTDVQTDGLPAEASAFRLLRSEIGHPTADEAAAKMGLGESATVTVPVDEAHRMDAAALAETVERLVAEGQRPFAVTATAGTTDYGSIDPLAEIADVADEYDLWFHVDAAYGGALAVSDRHREKLAGIERADSVAVDFHKFLFQPASCGIFLLREEDNYRYLGHEAAYLNPGRDSVPHRTEKSVQWTRRADVLKPFVTFQTVGREGMAALVDAVIELANRVDDLVAEDPAFDLISASEISTTVFRYCPQETPETVSHGVWADEINDAIRDAALADGRTLLARTQADGRTYLKFTLLNPCTSLDDVAAVLDLIREFGREIESDLSAGDIR